MIFTSGFRSINVVSTTTDFPSNHEDLKTFKNINSVNEKAFSYIFQEEVSAVITTISHILLDVKKKKSKKRSVLMRNR